uniref:Uncharacterized protein n=1 Tax=Aegilops tauschii TaxID=37682 RepID=M8BCD6_AEGTA
MSVRIKAVVDRFVKELQEALDADIQDRIMKEREMQSYIQEREREVAEREAAWKAELSRREVVIPAPSALCLLSHQSDSSPCVCPGVESVGGGVHRIVPSDNCYALGANYPSTVNMSIFEVSEVQAEIARQEARLKMEKENLEKEKSVLMGTASNQDNQDGALEITVSGEKYRCLRFSKAKK